MKALFFWLLVLVNLAALAVSLMFFSTHRTYEALTASLAFLANLIGVLYTKPHWKPQRAERIVTQNKNVAGRDIAAGNITKG